MLSVFIHRFFPYNKRMLLSFTLFLFLPFFVSAKQNEEKSVLSDVRMMEEKGDRLKVIYPDSAIFWYNRAINLISEEKYPGIKLSLKKVDLLSKTAFIFQNQNRFFLSSEYFGKALALAQTAGVDSLIAYCEFNLAEINLENGKYSDALSGYSNALEYYSSAEDADGIFWSHIGIAIIFKECGNAELSEKHYLSALKIGEEHSDNFYLGVANNNLGNLYVQTGNYKSALNSLLSSLDYFYKSGEEQHISDCLESIGEFYLKYKDYRLALDYFLKSLKIAENINDNYRLFSRYANAARTYMYLDQDENTLMYIGKTLELANSVGDKNRLSEILVIISDYFAKNRDYENALIYLNRAENIAEETGDTVSIALSRAAIAEVFYNRGENKNAAAYAENAQGIARSRKITEILKQTSFLLSRIFKSEGNYEAALKNFSIYSDVKDSLITKEKVKAIEQTKAKYNFERLENEKLSAENNTLLAERELFWRNIYILILGLFIIIILFFYIRYYLKRKKEIQENRNRQISLTKKIDLLKSQVDTKNRELTSKAVMISQNNKVLEEISSAIDLCLNGGSDERNELRKLKNMLESAYQERSWDDFLKHFEEVHPEFYKNLNEKCPDLSSGEQKICAFLRMNLNTKEISQITGQTTKSIEVARTRIRKKLNIDHNESLNSTIQNI